jgi:hypothetical protein
MKLDLNNKRNRKYSNTWRLNNTLLKNQWMTEEIREEIKKFLESNENENTTYQNLWDTAKAMLRETFITKSGYTKKPATSQINNLIMHLMFLKNKNKPNPKPADGAK